MRLLPENANTTSLPRISSSTLSVTGRHMPPRQFL
nr:MAG TPA: hypothetical protein [Caudoviricetes sp.]